MTLSEHGQKVTPVEATPRVVGTPKTERAGSLARRLRLHPALIVIAGACTVLLRQAIRAGLSGDVFFQVAAGQWMLQHGTLIRHDVFSYTVKGRPWLDEEWGFQVLLAWLVRHVGPASYWLVSAGACMGAVAVGTLRWRKSGAGWLWTAALAVLAAAGLSVGLTPRPQDISYLLFAVLMLVLTAARQRPVWLVTVPGLLALWANLHGSFLLGLGVLCLEVVWSALPPVRGRSVSARPLPKRAALVTLVASGLATLANPHGPGLIAYALRVSSSSQLANSITEWQSPNFHSYLLLAVIIGPVVVVAALLAFSSTRLPSEDLALMGLLWVATLHAVRFTPYFALAACSVLASWRPVRRETLSPSFVTSPFAVVLCALLLVGPHEPAGAPMVGGGPLGTPVIATRLLAHEKGHVFTSYWWSDYLIFKGVPVFVDGRTDLYFGTDVLATYEGVASLSLDPAPVFRRWHVRWVMWGRGSALTTYLYHDRAWKAVLTSQGAVVFEHLGAW